MLRSIVDGDRDGLRSIGDGNIQIVLAGKACGLDKTGEGVEYGNELIRMLRLDPELCNFTTLNIFYEQYTVLEGGGTVLGGGGEGVPS